MKQVLLAGLFLSGLALQAGAQDKPVLASKDRTETVKVTVTGEVDLDYVWRGSEITAFTGGVDGTSTPADSASENTFEGFVALRLNAELSDKVSAMVEFGTKRADSGSLNFFAAPSGSGSESITLKLREASILIQELFMTELRAEVGISTWNFDIRGKGQSMAFDPRHAQAFARNIAAAPDADGSLAARAGDYQEFEPVGAWFRWAREKILIDVVLLPAVIEGGSPHNDEAFYAVDLLYKLDDKDSRFGFIAAATSDPGGGSLVATYGGGFDWRGTANLDVYGEIYFQNGRNDPAGAAPSIDVSGFAYQIGAEYTLSVDAKAWIGANLTYFSGDDELDSKSTSFASYENIHDLLIIEDMYLGFDWDTNYRAIKIAGGFALNAAGARNLRLSAIVGICQTAEAVRFGAIPVPDNTHQLGNEADLRADWDFTNQLSINAGIAYLWASKVLENSMGGPDAPRASKNTLLFTIGTDLRF